MVAVVVGYPYSGAYSTSLAWQVTTVDEHRWGVASVHVGGSSEVLEEEYSEQTLKIPPKAFKNGSCHNVIINKPWVTKMTWL